MPQADAGAGEVSPLEQRRRELEKARLERAALREASAQLRASRAQPVGTPGVSAATLPLAQGELDERDAAELVALKRQIIERAGFQCEGYKEKCLRRRIAVRMRARATHTYGEYARLLESDREEYERLLDTLTINVTKFYRNPDVWAVVRDTVLPALFERPEPTLHVWSAGTSSGEEAYTISTLVQDTAPTPEVAARFDIVGTDIDRESLAWAARGEYLDFSMSDIDPAVRDRWFTHGGKWMLNPEARRNVRFDTLDLIRDEYPKGQHLIFCRNVIIYFERSIQEELFRRFHDALVPGGYLVLGKVEALFGSASGLFETVANRQRVFRRP